MSPAAQQPSPLLMIGIYLLVIALFVWRMARPRRMFVVQLWIMPAFLVALTALSIWASSFASAMGGQQAAPPWQVGTVLAVGALLGIPLGLLRGKHSDVRLTDRKGLMFVKSSGAIVFIWLAVFIVRAAVRYVVPGASTGASIWGDGLLAFAVAAIIASNVAIYNKYKALAAAPS